MVGTGAGEIVESGRQERRECTDRWRHGAIHSRTLPVRCLTPHSGSGTLAACPLERWLGCLCPSCYPSIPKMAGGFKLQNEHDTRSYPT